MTDQVVYDVHTLLRSNKSYMLQMEMKWKLKL